MIDNSKEEKMSSLKKDCVSGNVRISWWQKMLNPDGTTGVGSPRFTLHSLSTHVKE